MICFQSSRNGVEVYLGRICVTDSTALPPHRCDLRVSVGRTCAGSISDSPPGVQKAGPWRASRGTVCGRWLPLNGGLSSRERHRGTTRSWRAKGPPSSSWTFCSESWLSDKGEKQSSIPSPHAYSTLFRVVTLPTGNLANKAT